MNKFLIPSFCAAVLAAFPACTTVEEHHPVTSTTTTTEERSIHRAPVGVVGATTETRTVRTY